MAPTNPPNPLKKELETYRRLLPSLLDRQGQFAVISGEQLLGTFSTWEDACKVGYSTLGTATPFLVKKIEENEQVNYFTRNIGTSPTCPTTPSTLTP